MKRNFRLLSVFLSLLLLCSLSLTSCDLLEQNPLQSTPQTTTADPQNPPITPAQTEFDLSLVPAFSGEPYYVVNNNNPFFTDEEITTDSYEYYAPRDELDRCTVTMACLGKDLMPTGERGSISHVKPTGWHSVSYPSINADSLYNRCHLIGWQLTGEDANRENLVTGTSFMNNKGMLPFENQIADYIKETNNHVMYRVTPIFEGNNLVCTGVLMEAYSVEDEGDGICFNVFCYNNQPGVIINYATGESRLEDESNVDEVPAGATYIINTSSKKIHRLDSKYQGALTANMEYTTKTMGQLLKEGYTTCGTCKPQ